jgi:hypothetical protein
MPHKPLEFRILINYVFYLKVELCFLYFLFSTVMKCNLSLFFLICCRCLVENYGAKAPNLQKFVHSGPQPNL